MPSLFISASRVLAWLGGRSWSEADQDRFDDWETSTRIGMATLLAMSVTVFAWLGALFAEGLQPTQAWTISLAAVGLGWWWDRELRRAAESSGSAVHRCIAYLLRLTTVLAVCYAGHVGAPPVWMTDTIFLSPRWWWAPLVALTQAAPAVLLFINPLEPSAASRREAAAAESARMATRLRSWNEMSKAARKPA